MHDYYLLMARVGNSLEGRTDRAYRVVKVEMRTNAINTGHSYNPLGQISGSSH